MMRWLGSVSLALLLSACGGSVSQDPSGSGAQAGGGGASGSGAAGGSAGFGGSGAVAGTAGAGATAGAGGTAPYCCASDNDCPQYLEDGLSSECINGVCKEMPGPGQCWDDADCYGGACVGGSVCPCMADCFAADQLGVCSNGPETCCKTNKDCNGGVCASGVCKPPPPPGQCWNDDDCTMGICVGASSCPCGFDCAAIDAPGWCMAPTPGGCCKTDMDCGDFAWVPCVNNVCKMPMQGYCWVDAECPAGQKCLGASVCPCGAACDMIDTPGKCG